MFGQRGHDEPWHPVVHGKSDYVRYESPRVSSFNSCIRDEELIRTETHLAVKDMQFLVIRHGNYRLRTLECSLLEQAATDIFRSLVVRLSSRTQT